MTMKTHKSKTYSIFLYFCLLGFLISNLFYPWMNLVSMGVSAYTNNSIQLQRYEGDGAWMHVDTFIHEADHVVEQYADALVRSNIKTIFILGKKIDGSVNYPSKNALKRSFSGDPMKRIVSILRSRKMEIFFYYPINTDPAWNAVHPEDIAWQYGNAQQNAVLQDPERKLVNLTSTAYRDYIRLLIADAFELYDINGIQLDYIRYRNAHWGFSPKELAMAKERGANINRIQELTYTTFVKPGDWNTLLKKYDEKDPDVLKWVQCKEDIIFSFAENISQFVKNKNKQFSTTLIHSGASKSAYGAVHFSQSYPRLSAIADIAVPMAYHGSNPQVAKMVQEVIDGSKEQIAPNCRIMIGLQAYETSSLLMSQATRTVQKNKLGFVLFRIGTFTLIDLQLETREDQESYLHATMFNSIPQQSIQGFEVRGLGGMFQMQDNCWDKDQCSFEDGFKIWGKVFSDKIGSFSISLPLKNTPEYLSDFVRPMVVLADAQKDIPSYTTGRVHFQHYILSLSSNKLKTTEASFQVQLMQNEGLAFIKAEDLKYCNIVVKHEANQNLWSFTQGFRKIVHKPDQNKFTIQFDSNGRLLEHPKQSPKLSSGWVPVRLLFELLGYTLFYNPHLKEIHIIKSQVPGSLIDIEQWKKLSEPGWLLNVDDHCTIAIQEYLNEDFYKISHLLHSKGRQIRLRVNASWEHSANADAVFWMMQERSIPWYQADQIEWK
jgi:uncharacterized lipoprotein YddW (UPF0748 family)